MSEEELQHMAAQLRQPAGEAGIKIGEWMNSGNLQMNQDTLKVLNPQNGEHILEIGMGNGFFVKEILQNKALTRYSGCDLSEEMVLQAKKLNQNFVDSEQAQFIQGNAAQLPFAENSFDKIFTVNTIYFWDNEKAVLDELKRVLKPGGSLLIALRPKHQMQQYPFIKYGFNIFSKEDLSALLTENGWKLLELYENKENNLELNGLTIRMENLIAVATKN